jgi:uncharacterized protein (DUF433 family)
MTTIMAQHIEIVPEVRGGRPHLAGTRIAASDVVLMHLRLAQTLEEIAGKYDLSLAAVYAAMTYYYDHRDEIERDLEEDTAYAEAVRRNNPSLLQARLRALGHA